MTWEMVLGVAGGVVVFYNAAMAVYKAFSPAAKLHQEIEDLKVHDKNDYERINALIEMNKAQSRLLLAIIDHMIDGNHAEQMRETRREIINIIGE